MTRARESICFSASCTTEPAHCHRDESFFRTYSSRTGEPAAASQPPQLP